MPSAPFSEKQKYIMKIKTYGVPELTEWHGKVKAGSIEVNLSFRGGTSSPSGAQPAYLVTKDPIIQFVIENSKEFKNGFIILLMTQEMPGNHPRMRVAQKAVNLCDKGNSEKALDEEAGLLQDAEDNDANNNTKIEVGCLQDAQAYLQEKYGISSYKVRSYESAQKAAQDHGVEFVGGKFTTIKIEGTPEGVETEE